MKRLVVASLLLALGGFAHGYGLPWAVDSLPKAQSQAKQGAGKHVLVFYTSPT